MPPQPPIDFSPLDKMRHSFWRTVKNSLGGYGLVILVVLVAVCAGLAFTPAPGAGIYVAVAYFIAMSIMVRRYKNQVWEEFAAANHWPLGTISYFSNLRPPSINYGHSQKFSPAIRAQLGNIGCVLYTYNTTTGEGRYQTQHNFTVAAVILPRLMPHIILNSKKDKADIHTRFPDHESLKLEGDFNKYFNLLLQKGQEVNVLAIITPEIMQTLIADNNDEDIETAGQQLFFILRNDKRDTESVKRLISSVEALSAQIIRNINLDQPLAPTPVTAPASALQTTAQNTDLRL